MISPLPQIGVNLLAARLPFGNGAPLSEQGFFNLLRFGFAPLLHIVIYLMCGLISQFLRRPDRFFN